MEQTPDTTIKNGKTMEGEEEIKPTGDGARSERQEPDQLARIESELNDAGIPREVWIGTDSTADRVSWLITRNKLNQQNSHSRFKTMNELSDLVEGMLTAGDPSDSWWSRAEEVLVAAGRRPASITTERAALNPKPALYEAAQNFINACESHMPSWLGNKEARRGFDELRAALSLVDHPTTEEGNNE